MAKARLVRPGYLAPLASEVLPSPTIGPPDAVVTLNVTLGGLATLTLCTVTWGWSAAQAAFAASVGASVLLGTWNRMPEPPASPPGPGGPGGPCGPVGPVSPLQPVTRARAARLRAAANFVRAFIQPPRSPGCRKSRSSSSSSRSIPPPLASGGQGGDSRPEQEVDLLRAGLCARNSEAGRGCGDASFAPGAPTTAGFAEL